MNELTLTHETKTPKWFIAVLFAGLLLFAFYASTHMVAAGDTWVAMACGRHFDNHGVDTVEPFSFNSHPAGPSEETLEKYPGWTRGLIKKWHPTGWINQNWLAHLIFYKLASWFGEDGSYNYNTLVYWKFAIYFLAVICIYATGKLMGAGDFLSAAGACFAMVIGRTFYDIRPSGYSNLLVPVFLLLLALTLYKNYRLIWLLVPLVVFWANVHGGYLYAFIMLVPFVAVHLLLRLPRRWSICLGFIGLWLVLYLMSYQCVNHEYPEQIQKALRQKVEHISLFDDKLFYVCLVLSIISLALTFLKNTPSGLFYAYHVGVGFVWFLSLLFTRFFPNRPTYLHPQLESIYSAFVSSSQLAFIFVFIVGSLLVLAMALKKERFIALPIKGVYHTIGAGVVAFVAMIIFNPFHLTNLTHTLEISVSKHAESWRQVNEWKPAFDWMDKMTMVANPVGNEEAFAVLCILTLITLLFWLVAQSLRPRPTIKGVRKKPSQKTPIGTFQWPKVDLAIIVISLLTMYMAVRSRRFIAIAGSAAAPAVFLMILQSWQMLSARLSWKKKDLLQPATLGPMIQRFTRYGTVLIILGFGIFWGMKYKHIYLDPWPSDDRYNDVFMRMTASHLKPFDVCEFISDNQISGRVFNYWTEGGAIAFGQNPDPKTGQIPLKLFMDGRAQAAYNHDKFKLWQMIHSGGSIAQRAMIQDKKITPERMKEVGGWIDDALNRCNVWVVLMPKSQENSTFMRALKQRANWKTAYLDNTQHLLVNIEAPQGRELIDKILDNEAVFPNIYSRNITTSTAIFENNHRQRFGDLYPLIKAAFEANPNPTSVLAMTRLNSLSTLRTKITADLQAYLDDFVKYQDTYRKQDGYFLRLASADISARFLAQYHPAEKKKLAELIKPFRNESKSLSQAHIW